MKLRISLLTILIGMLFASCGLSTGKVAEQKDEGISVLRYDKLFDFANRMSPLGNATADECADYCIVMFSDLTRKVTMQNLFHDGGFSSVGMSLRAMATYEKGLDEYKDENGNIIYG